MEVKVRLNKPYTEKQKLDFIVECNHRCGFEIVETETALEAWGNTDQEELEQAKNTKYEENDERAKKARVSQTFTVTLNNVDLLFDTTRETQQDLLTAKDFLSAGLEKYDWWDNNGTHYAFTSVDEIITISSIFMEKANIYSIWSYYKNLIDNAETTQEVKEIDLDYNINLGEQNDITE